MAPIQPLDASEFPPLISKGFIRQVRATFEIPPSLKLFQARDSFRPHRNPNKYGKNNKLFIYVDQLEGGLRFPLDPFVKQFSQAYAIAPS